MYRSTPTLHMSAPQWVISKLSTSGAKIKNRDQQCNKINVEEFLAFMNVFSEGTGGF